MKKTGSADQAIAQAYLDDPVFHTEIVWLYVQYLDQQGKATTGQQIARAFVERMQAADSGSSFQVSNNPEVWQRIMGYIKK